MIIIGKNYIKKEKVQVKILCIFDKLKENEIIEEGT